MVSPIAAGGAAMARPMTPSATMPTPMRAASTRTKAYPISRQATGLTRRHSPARVSFSATTAWATSLTTIPWTITPRAPAPSPSTIPAMAVIAIDPANTVSNSSVPDCRVSSRENAANAMAPIATRTTR